MRFEGLWRNADFRKLWAGQTVSVFGSFIGNTALRFTAILTLDAQAYEMSLLLAFGIVPELLSGPLIGVWVDRARRRPIMIAADLGRAALLASIPAAYAFDALTIEQLYAVAFLTGILTMAFGVAYRSYLPSLVRKDEVLEGNGKLSASESVSEVAGFGVAGWLVQALTGPVAILIDAISFLASAVFVRQIRKEEPAPTSAVEREGIMREMGEGLRAIARHSHLRTTLVAESTSHIAFGMFGAVFMLYAVRVLDVEAGLLGVIAAVGGASSLVGALMAGRAAARFGTGSVMALGVAIMGVSMLLVPLAEGPAVVLAAFLVAQQLGDGGYVVFDVNQVTLRQTVTEDRLLGRVNAVAGICAHSALLGGVLAGGVLGEVLGLRGTLAIAGVIMLGTGGWLAVSPVRGLRGVIPEPTLAAPDAPEMV